MKRLGIIWLFGWLVAWSLACGGRGPDSVALGERLGAESRSEQDRARDAGRHPVEVIAFLGIRPGDTVVDLIAASGYYTEVLSVAVGPTGKVYAQNNAFVLKMRDGVNDRAMTARLAKARLPNVQRLDREMDDLGLAANSIDAAITALNYHDIHNSRGPDAAAGFLRVVYDFLKPGGVLGLIDHAGNPGADNKTLHRIDEILVRKAATAAGFEIESSNLLRNAKDDRRGGVFEPGLRGKTDRFLLRLRKPER